MIHRRLLQLARGVLGPVGVCVLMGLLVTATYLAQALLLAGALVALFDQDIQQLLVLLGWAAVLIGVRAVLTWLRELVTAWAGGVIRAHVRDRLVTALAALGPAYLTDARAGAVRATIVDGVDGLDPYYSRYLPQVLITAVVPAALVGWMFTIDPGAATVLAVSVLLVLTIPRFKDATLLRTGRHRWVTYLDISADYLEAMQGLPTLRAFGAAGRRRDALEARSHRLYRDTMAELRVSLLENGITALLIGLGTAGAVLVAALGPPTMAPDTAAATMFVVLLVAVECFRPVRDLTRAWHAGYLGITAVDGLNELLGARPAVCDHGDQPARWPPGQPPTIEFRDVCFTYPGASTPALQSVSLTIPAGSTTALVGRSGAGKSTLAALLARTYDPDLGSVLLDHTTLPALRLDELRRTMAQVGQHTYLFAASVADNLRLGAPRASDAELVAACHVARAHDFITALPKGYQTVLDEGGRSLSGGQRQRLALARAVIRDAAVLVLDEATSHVDTAGEQAIATALAQVRVGRTCVIIAHRLSSLAGVDHIAVIDGGRIVQHGTPAELTGQPGPYADLVAAQTVPVS